MNADYNSSNGQSNSSEQHQEAQSVPMFNRMASLAMIFGTLSLLFGFLFYEIAPMCAIPAIILAVKSRRPHQDHNPIDPLGHCHEQNDALKSTKLVLEKSAIVGLCSAGAGIIATFVSVICML